MLILSNKLKIHIKYTILYTVGEDYGFIGKNGEKRADLNKSMLFDGLKKCKKSLRKHKEKCRPMGVFLLEYDNGDDQMIIYDLPLTPENLSLIINSVIKG